jgi:hypothetical protein
MSLSAKFDESAETERLRQLLVEKGPNVFLARSKFHDPALYKQVWTEHMQKVTRPTFGQVLLRAIFS